MDVAMTVEPQPDGYGQNMITIERGNAESVQILMLTDWELAQLACLLENYQATLSTAWVSFTDHSGRPPAIQEEAAVAAPGADG